MHFRLVVDFKVRAFHRHTHGKIFERESRNHGIVCFQAGQRNDVVIIVEIRLITPYRSRTHLAVENPVPFHRAFPQILENDIIELIIERKVVVRFEAGKKSFGITDNYFFIGDFIQTVHCPSDSVRRSNRQ
ncbi:hypothetical protein ES708_23543 [subsurface metagenome]